MEMVFITGGQKSGKSTLAEKCALSLSQKSSNQKPIYLATSQVRDSELANRVEKHKAQRGDRFETIEEPLYLSNALVGVSKDRWVLLECLTLWLAQIWEYCEFDYDMSLSFFEEEWSKLRKAHSKLIVVGNEIGLGVHPIEKNMRQVVDLYGVVNKRVLSESSKAYFCVAGGVVALEPIESFEF